MQRKSNYFTGNFIEKFEIKFPIYFLNKSYGRRSLDINEHKGNMLYFTVLKVKIPRSFDPGIVVYIF